MLFKGWTYGRLQQGDPDTQPSICTKSIGSDIDEPESPFTKSFACYKHSKNGFLLGFNVFWTLVILSVVLLRLNSDQSHSSSDPAIFGYSKTVCFHRISDLAF